MKKKILSAILSLCMVLTFLPANVLAGESGENDDRFAPNSSSETALNDNVLIYTAEDFIMTDFSSGHTVTLMNDIDLGNYFSQWQPKILTGVFDGNNHTIYNLRYDFFPDEPLEEVGLFSELRGTIQNLRLENIDFSGELICDSFGCSIGAFAGNVSASFTTSLKNCSASGRIAITSNAGGELKVGGLTGDSCRNMDSCMNEVSLDIDGSKLTVYAGGLIAERSNLNSLGHGVNTVQNSINNGTININAKSALVGGIVGVGDKLTITDCTNNGDIDISTGKQSICAGGICGTSESKLSIESCANTATLTGNSSGGGCTIGGILGGTRSSSGARIISNCYNSGDLNMGSSFDGLPGYAPSIDVGGIFGGGYHYCTELEISLCYNSGQLDANAVSDSATINLGGIVGYGKRGSSRACYYLENTANSVNGCIDSEGSYVGVPLQEDDAKKQSSYNGFNFETIWIMGQGVYEYPVLRSLTNVPEVTTYKITYDLNGGNGNVPVSQSFQSGELATITEIIPEREDYTFAGWSDGTTTYQAGQTFVMPRNNVTLTAVWKDNTSVQDDKDSYVDTLISYSLINASEETKNIIHSAILNLIFNAQYRPTKGPKINGISPAFTGSVATNKTWPAQNNGKKYAYSVTDSILGKVKFAEGGLGCMSYALFATAYTYGTSGNGIRCMDLSQQGIKSFVQKYADPGEQLRYTHSRGIHSIVFLGESQNEQGFYYISYDGGRDGSGNDYPGLYVDYQSYEAFAKKVTSSLTVRDANGGSYYAGTAKNISDVRNYNKVSRQVIRIACPVEAVIQLEDEMLDSRSPGEASFGSVARIGEEIVFDLDYNPDYSLSIEGTGTGTMTLTLEYYEDETLLDTRTIKDSPIDPSVKIQSSAFDPQASFVLYANSDYTDEQAWGVGIDETVYEPNEDYSSKNNGPEEDATIPDTPSTPTTPSYDSDDDSDSDYDETPIVASNSGGTVKAFYNGRVQITPNPGYEVESVTVNGKEVDLPDSGNLRGLKKDDKVEVTFRPVNSKDPEPAPDTTVSFTDVSTGAYYYDAVQWAVKNGITSGTSANTFSPNATCTRAQMVTFLWRAAGSPASQRTENSFTDVSPNAYYYDAVLWAVEQGITAGTSATTFGPDDTVTRGQTVTFLHRTAGSPPAGNGVSFTDVDGESYYANAVQWGGGRKYHRRDRRDNLRSQRQLHEGADCDIPLPRKRLNLSFLTEQTGACPHGYAPTIFWVRPMEKYRRYGYSKPGFSLDNSDIRDYNGGK